MLRRTAAATARTDVSSPCGWAACAPLPTCGRRGRRRGGWRAAAKIEIHLRGNIRSLSGRKIGSRGKAEQTCEKCCWHALHGPVVCLHRLVEFAAFNGDAILGSLELRLQFLEIGVRL